MTSSSQQSLEKGKFFYAVILADKEKDVGLLGLNGEKVHFIFYKDIAAVVSGHPRVDVIKLLRKNLSPYHRVCRELGKTFTTLPAKFGQIAKDEHEVRKVLEANYTRIRSELSRLHNKVEMGLTIFWQVDDVFQYFLSKDAELKSRREKLLQRGGSASRMERLNFGEFFHQRMIDAKDKIAKQVISLFPAEEIRIEEPSEEKMVMNVSLLVTKNSLKNFDEALTKVANMLGEEYSVKVDGPWLPFSFVKRLELGFNR
ncbi:GvpL/GvpF family gas vesicle protein [Candidatus Aerophobetes bacterium]|nr:GvpL/GvpF family gas vesicle protein [Candidatus Aerophobetes bacterium]